MAKVVFLGTPEFAVPPLNAIVEAKHEISLVVTAPDSRVGRGMSLSESAVAKFAKSANLAVIKPQKVSDVVQKIIEIKPDLIVLSAYGKILPRAILEIPKCGALNIHPSLLPKYRGASPIQSAILHGEKVSGLTIILMNDKMDEGPILAQKEIDITANDDYPSLSTKLAELSAKLVVEVIPKFLDGALEPRNQDETQATYTKLISKGDGRIQWSGSAEEIDRMIRAYRPWPGSYTTFEGKLVKILDATPAKSNIGADRDGLISNDSGRLLVQCGKDSLVVTTLLLEGKKAVAGPQFLIGLQKNQTYKFV